MTYDNVKTVTKMLSFNGSAKCPIIAICMWRNNVIYSPGSHKNVNRGTQSKISGLNKIHLVLVLSLSMMNMQNTKHMQATIHPLGDSCCVTVLRLHVCALIRCWHRVMNWSKLGALSDNWNPGENCNSDNQMFHLFAFDGEFNNFNL